MAHQQTTIFVKVQQQKLQKLVTETMQLKALLPKVVHGDILHATTKLRHLEMVLEDRDKEVEKLRLDCEHLRAKLDIALGDCQKEKEDKLKARRQLSDAQRQLEQQADFCTSLGAVVCTLLWRVSRSECKVKEFFTLASQTVESYVKSMPGDFKTEDAGGDESQFVLAMAGIVTNIAATACGREYLMSMPGGKTILDVFLQILMELSTGQCIKFKTLILMTLYNVSINTSGLLYLAEKQGMVKLLCWLLEGEQDAELRCHALRLIQSLLLEPGTSQEVADGVRSCLPEHFLQSLVANRHVELRDAAKELHEDLQAIHIKA
ncbi:heat shock factor 2-binding protein isoform X3 [Petromyzon marinus]|uniref:heat shock factor 2-binding protein isoform X3 n=1 Tax=Petromyzon marinus TaxID=7757 RepID=UPI003F70CB5C